MKAFTNIKPKCVDDTNDCSVVTTAAVTGTSYIEASAKCTAAGRIRNKGFSDADYYQVIREMGFTIRRIAVESKTVRTIERELAAKWGGCKVIIRVAKHVLAWDGTEIVDWSAGRQHRIMWADLVYPSSELLPVGKSVPVPERKALKRPPMKRNGVKVFIDDNLIGDYSSIAAAYKANGWSLRGHQRVRLIVKRHGSATVYHWKGNIRFELIE